MISFSAYLFCKRSCVCCSKLRLLLEPPPNAESSLHDHLPFHQRRVPVPHCHKKRSRWPSLNWSWSNITVSRAKLNQNFSFSICFSMCSWQKTNSIVTYIDVEWNYPLHRKCKCTSTLPVPNSTITVNNFLMIIFVCGGGVVCLLVLSFFFAASFSKNQSREIFYTYFGLLDKVIDFWKIPKKEHNMSKKLGNFIDSNNRSPILKVNEWMRWHQKNMILIYGWQLPPNQATFVTVIISNTGDQFDGFKAVVVFEGLVGALGRFGGWSMKIQL